MTRLSWSKLFCCMLVALVTAAPVHGENKTEEDKKRSDAFARPAEHGVYVKTEQALKRLMPNIVFEEGGLLYLESINPPHFPLKDLEDFVVYGIHDLRFLTLNRLVPIPPSPVGKPRFMFGKEIPCEVKKQGNNLCTVRSKELMGRGYFALWINDMAWDFLIE